MDNSCSFFGFGGIFCNKKDANDSAYEIRKLLDCQDDISGHLAGCGLSKENINESKLLLLRAGRFEVSDHQQHYLFVCSAHRCSLGRKWRPLRSCQYPGHTGRSHQYKNPTVFTPCISREVLALYGSLVQIGSRKYILQTMLKQNISMCSVLMCVVLLGDPSSKYYANFSI